LVYESGSVLKQELENHCYLTPKRIIDWESNWNFWNRAAITEFIVMFEKPFGGITFRTMKSELLWYISAKEF
jgi:hypothetical protein